MRRSIGSDALKLTISKLITMAIALVNAMLLSRFRTLEGMVLFTIITYY